MAEHCGESEIFLAKRFTISECTNDFPYMLFFANASDAKLVNRPKI